MILAATLKTTDNKVSPLIAQWATEEDYAYAKRRNNKQVQNNALLTRSVLRALLFKVTKRQGWLVRPDLRGKPQIASFDGSPGPHISVSHTRGMVACAVSSHSVLGLDIEYWQQRDFVSIADYAFGPRERVEVARDGISAFYRIWTVKEAIAKATGEGLLMSIDGKDYLEGGEWNVFTTSLLDSFSLAIAHDNKNMQVELMEVTKGMLP